MTAIKFACVSPHPPVIVREVGMGRERQTQRTIDALEQVAADIACHRPHTVLLMATHGPLNPGAFFLLSAPTVAGDFSRWGAPQVRLRFEGDTDLAAAIQREAEQSNLPVDLSDRWDGGLDWSCTVPLYYLRSGMPEARLVPMNIALLSPRDHFDFGRAVRRAADRAGSPAVIIASADLSHRLTADGPYGYHPAGPKLDRLLQDAIAAWDVDAVLAIDEAFRDTAGDDAVPSLSFLMGALDGLRVRPRILSYEGPFGVGYMVAAIDILDEDESDPVTRAAASVEQPLQTAATPSHPLVRLARDAVEAFILRRHVLDPAAHHAPAAEGLPPRAGCFVSIRTSAGALRGCIGSIDPIEPTLSLEVVRNAIQSATRDPRFLPVTAGELSDLVYSVDVLSPPEPVDGLHALDPRRYGVIVRHGVRRGLLLPAIEGVDTAEQQVAIAMSKALIAPQEPVSLWRFAVRRLT